ncbi:MAG: T9SS type A sorting domain-containing protein [Bacteroidales bacterium]|nr:T9SS type A sorting domain-containing protein [Bacteroidales bacterium]
MKKTKHCFSLLIMMMGIMGLFAQEANNLYPKVKRLEGQGNGGNWLEITEQTRDNIMSGAPWKVQQVEYEHGASPVVVRVTNPSELKPYEYYLSLNDYDNFWKLKWYDSTGTQLGEYMSQYTIEEGKEEIVEGHGIAITMKNHPFSIHDKNLAFHVSTHGGNTYQNYTHYAQPDLIGSQVIYHGDVQWLDGLKDAETSTPDNWIRAGHYKSTHYWVCYSGQPSMAECDYSKWRTEDFFNLYNTTTTWGGTNSTRGYMDYYGQYEHVAQGSWAPYMLSSPYDGGPKAQFLTKDVIFGNNMPSPAYYDFRFLESVPNRSRYNQTLTNLYSVDIIFTPDTSLWTRALVLESGSGTVESNYKVIQHFNGQTYQNIRHEPKACPSVDKNGNPDNSGTYGFGWFPGYAINVETGERLNIMFAENSEDEYNHGNDMIFNPTNVYAFRKNNEDNYILDDAGNPIPMTQEEYNALYSSSLCDHEILGEPLYGGRHYVYICGSSGNTCNVAQQRNYNNDGYTTTVQGVSHGGVFTGSDGVSYPYYECGVYDEGKWLKEKFNTLYETDYDRNSRKAKKMQVFNNVMWTGIPMPKQGLETEWLANEATVSIRVSRPFMKYTSAVGTGPDHPVNNNAPLFSFTTNDLYVAQSHNLFDLSNIIVSCDNRIDVNNIDAPVSPHSGAWFYDEETHNADYVVPKGADKRPLFNYSFWMGGKDGQNNLHVFAERFRQQGYETWPGPLSTIDASIDEETLRKWDRTFKITRKEVLEFMACRQNPEYTVPQHILEWPAHGDTTKGQAWLLAPFIDIDGDNHYDPTQGDYPDFPGDMAQFVIFNDNYAQHGESQGAPMGVEVHVMVYAFDAPEDSIMNNTLFIKYKLFNRSQNEYHQTYIGLWNDWDLGYAYDDYVGCDVMKNTAYCYNGSEIDGTGQYWAYDSLWPVQTLTLLSGPLMPADGQDNPAYTSSSDCSTFMNNGLNEYGINGTDGFGDGIVDNERYGLTGFVYHANDYSVTSDPQFAAEYYNLMRGVWKDGSHVRYGGNGHTSNGGNGPECNFMFPALTDNCNLGTHGVDPNSSQYGTDGWTEANVGNEPSDRRGLASVGPFNLEAGGVQELELCLVTIPHSYAVTPNGITLDSLYRINPQYHSQQLVTPIVNNVYDTICEGDSINFFGTIYREAGSFPHLVPNSSHTDEIADTIHYLHLTVTPTYTFHEVSACDSLVWNDSTYTSSMEYIQSFTTENGCEFQVIQRLTVTNTHNVEYASLICDDYYWHGHPYREPGTYTYEYVTANGCQGTDTLHLERDTTIVNDTVFGYYYYNSNGTTISIKGQKYLYQYIIAPDKYAQWADSMLTTFEWIDSTYISLAYDSSTNIASFSYIEVYDYRNLPGDNSIWEDFYLDRTYKDSTYYDVFDTLTGLSSIGCDSTVVWNTRIMFKDIQYLYNEECGNYIWQGDSLFISGTTSTGTTIVGFASGDSLTESGTYYQNLTNVSGSDSTVTRYLIIHPTVFDEITYVGCENHTFNDISYTESGVYTFNYDTTLTITRNLFWNNNQYQWGYWNSLGLFCANRPKGWSNRYSSYVDGEYVHYYYDANGVVHYLNSPDQVVQYMDTVKACKLLTLDLTINHSVTNTFEVTACDSYTWNDSTYTTSGEYVQTFTSANGCDSTVTLQLTINESKHTDTTAESCGSYTWNETTYTSSGEYIQNFTAANGCDSTVTLQLTILPLPTPNITGVTTVCEGQTATLNATGGVSYLWEDGTTTNTYPATVSGLYTVTVTNAEGCSATASTTVTVNPLPEVAITGNTAICPGGSTVLTATGADSYQWSNGSTNPSIPVNMFGQYSVIGTSSAGCFSTASVTVLVSQPPVITISGNTDICAGESTTLTANGGVSYMWSNGSTADTLVAITAGNWQVIGYNADGCSNMASVTVNVWQPASSDLYITAFDSCYMWFGTPRCESGDYTHTLQTIHGCDSVIILHLTLEDAITTEFSATSCDSYTWNGITYSQSGNYTQNFTAVNGNDSIVTLHLTINYSVSEVVEVTACDSYEWNGQTYTSSGNYTQTFIAANECDSVVTLNLTVNPSVSEVVEATACDSYLWNDSNYTVSGDYIQIFTAANGCDSVVTLHLTINHPVAEFVETTVCDSYEWNGQSYVTSGDYTQTFTAANGCDSVVTLHLIVNDTKHVEFADSTCTTYTWNGQSYAQSGDYTQNFTAANGCDSVVTLHLTIVPTITPVIAVNGSLTACGNGSATLTVPGNYSNFVWSTGAVSSALTVNEAGYYWVTATDVYGCEGVSEMVQLGGSVQIDETPAICMVGVDNDHNLVVWEPLTDPDVSEYRIYREDGQANIFEPLAVIPASNSNAYVDATADPSVRAYRYKITAADTCGGETPMSAFHKTVHLTINQGLGNSYNLIWTPYEGFEFSSYKLYRGTANNNLQLIQTMPSTLTSYTDNNPAGDALFYQIEVVMTESCVQQTRDITYTGARSNIVYNGVAVTTEVTIEACDSYDWNGQILTSSGDYTQNFVSELGYDSVVTLHLTINPSVTEVIEVTTLDSCYTWNGQDYCTSGTYTQTLQTVHGCDSVVTMHLTITVGVNDYDGFDFKVYPNPTTGVVNVQITNHNSPITEFHVFDAYGKLIRVVDVQTTQIDLSGFASGVYFIKAVSDGNVVAVRKVVKQ